MTFLLYPKSNVPALRDSHSQAGQTAQVVKDPGRELGEGVRSKGPIDSPHNHPRSPSHMTHSRRREEGMNE